MGNQCSWCQDDAKKFYSWVDTEFVAEHGVWLAWAPVKSTLKRSVFPLVFPTKPNLISHVFVLEVLLYSRGFDDTRRSISTTLPAQLGPSSRPTRIYRPCPLLSTTNMLGAQCLVKFPNAFNQPHVMFVRGCSQELGSTLLRQRAAGQTTHTLVEQSQTWIIALCETKVSDRPR